ncbi:hypothetical protein [Arthrobacter woluwensis]|uniref:hypothetical protein n=1 Tax=Arthrobacter woluwensis TaxID=156980 RepID=UPI0011A4388A|nr:hypothetical protein [Arthrobacter woluwensis]
MSQRKGRRVVCTATINPIGHRPLRDVANLSYRNDEELSAQLRIFTKHHWPEAYAIKIDTSTKTILINSVPFAHYHLNAPIPQEVRA